MKLCPPFVYIVKEHNMKMTKKFDHGGLDTTPASRSVPRSIPSTTPSESEHDHETSAEEGTERGTLATVYSHYASLENSRLQQLLGCKQLQQHIISVLQRK